MRIEPSQLEFLEPSGDIFEDGYCGAKPFGGDREHERAVHHNWVMDEEGGDILFSDRCGVSARLKIQATRA